MSQPDDAEIAFYRAVEDHFAALRGTPVLFSPKDFALLRRWWREGVPLAAVLAGVSEAAERRRERDGDPVSSLSYCRHAVARHAKRLAANRVGAAAPVAGPDVGAALAALAAALGEAAARWREHPAAHAVLADLERAVSSLPRDAEPAALEQALAELELGGLEALARALPAERRAEIERAVAEGMAGLAVEPEVRERTRRALLLRAVRLAAGVPRMELDAGTA